MRSTMRMDSVIVSNSIVIAMLRNVAHFNRFMECTCHAHSPLMQIIIHLAETGTTKHPCVCILWPIENYA